MQHLRGITWPPLIHTPSSFTSTPTTKFNGNRYENYRMLNENRPNFNSKILSSPNKMKKTDEFTVWQNLRAVDTIYEEEYEFSSSSSSDLSPLPPPPPQHLHSRVQQWCNVTGLKTDVCIRVNGQCLHLHKDPLASKSPYLKRQFAAASDVTVSPPLKITPKTFTIVADFCYGAPIVITPFNIAALRTAAELLEMSETDDDDDENLVYVTEKYFRLVVAVNRDYASVVFRSCLELLPEAETMAFLGSRCLEAWSVEDHEGDYNGDITCFGDFKCVEVENFMVLASSLNRRFKCHDLIYNIALLYLKGHGGKITEEQKVLICNFIDCDKLSPKLLLQAVQNPLMPLRFVVRAMLIEQLNTRNSILSTTTTAATIKPPPPRPVPKDPLTLGAILKRDAAARDSAKLKAAMHATNSRIRTLESQLNSMKKKLQQSEKQRSLSEDAGRGRSASFHHGVEKINSTNNNSKFVARGQRGSISSSVFRRSADFKTEYYKFGSGCKPFSDRGSSSNHDGERKSERSSSIGQRLINGIKNVFRVSSLGETESKVQSRDDEDDGGDLYEEDEYDDGDDEIVVMRRNQLYVK